MWPLQARLGNGIWHATHPERFVSIMAEGLKAEPAISNEARWKTSRGPEFYPFVRKIGGVSLFDFTNFDPDIYDRSHPMSNWRAFVPHREDWAGAVWIQIDRVALGANFISADELVSRWDQGGHHRHTIMPRIECACVGDTPTVTFVSAFFTWSRGRAIRDLVLDCFSEPVYRSVLNEWREALSGGRTE
ncbi:hypothetical protein [Pelagibacterium sp.]|uniref:hypothetical protein n=1 Tax=Pelagibacterium sp. TaxID=1967288 RepID=UPI003BA8ACE8